MNNIDYDKIKIQKETIFNNVLKSNNYAEVIKIFNEKGLAGEIGTKLGINKKEYQNKVINLLYGDSHDEIVNALVSYLPIEIPR